MVFNIQKIENPHRYYVLTLGACLVLPGLATLDVKSVSSLIEVIVKRKMATHVMIL
jgi:hypothetical protein